MEMLLKLLIVSFLGLDCVMGLQHENGTLILTTPECKDTLPTNYCELLKRNGACVAVVSRMMKLCAKTCIFCEEDCKDFLPALCPWWKAHLACYTHPKVLHKYCRKSCGLCPIAAAPPKPKCAFSKFGCCWDRKTSKGPNGECPECKDSLRFCKDFQRDCFYGRNRQFMLENCPRICRRCSRSN